MNKKDCKKLEQLYNKNGDPINSCTDGLDEFIKEYKKKIQKTTHPTEK